jgi:hypothetical protein
MFWEKIGSQNVVPVGSWDNHVRLSDGNHVFRMMNLDWSMTWFIWRLSTVAMDTAGSPRCFAGQAGM